MWAGFADNLWSMTKALYIIVLAAGQGKRMRSSRPKVLQPLAGRPLLAHVLATARELEPLGLRVVYGHGGEQVRAAFADQHDLTWVLQAQQKGTGHAVQTGLEGIPDQARVLVLLGDNPLITAATLRGFISASGDDLGILTARLADPAGYGRIVRAADGTVARIVEQADANATELAISEVNSGLLVGDAARLSQDLIRLVRTMPRVRFY